MAVIAAILCPNNNRFQGVVEKPFFLVGTPDGEKKSMIRPMPSAQINPLADHHPPQHTPAIATIGNMKPRR
jgi:hypothetical protein